MYEAVLAKFTQHADLREPLLATGDAKVVEHTENDAYWGDGGDGSGKNSLGQVLMRVREQPRSEPASGDGGEGAVGDYLIPSPRRGAMPGPGGRG